MCRSPTVFWRGAFPQRCDARRENPNINAVRDPRPTDTTLRGTNLSFPDCGVTATSVVVLGEGTILVSECNGEMFVMLMFPEAPI